MDRRDISEFESARARGLGADRSSSDFCESQGASHSVSCLLLWLLDSYLGSQSPF